MTLTFFIRNVILYFIILTMIFYTNTNYKKKKILSYLKKNTKIKIIKKIYYKLDF